MGTWTESRAGKQVYTGQTWCERDGRTQRVIFQVVQRTIAADGQRLLVPEIDIETWRTSLGPRTASAEEVIELCHQHGTSEQFHSEVKTDMNLEPLPSGKFATNALMLARGQVAYNVLRLCDQVALAEDRRLPPNARRAHSRTAADPSDPALRPSAFGWFGYRKFRCTPRTERVRNENEHWLGLTRSPLAGSNPIRDTVSAGRHTIAVENAGGCSLAVAYELGGFLLREGPDLQVRGMQTEDIILVWLKSPKLIWLYDRMGIQPQERPAGSLVLANVPEGTWVAEWLDTIENRWMARTVERSADGKLVLPTPPIRHSAAVRLFRFEGTPSGTIGE